MIEKIWPLGHFWFGDNYCGDLEKEFYSYQFDSLVSDFGGSLGLFIGFSFFTLWDIIKDLAILKFQAGK